MKTIIGIAICLLTANIQLSFGQIKYQYHDTWLDPLIICGTEDLVWQKFASVNSSPVDEFQTCIQPYEHISQVWLKFETQNSANLSFTIQPHDDSDDIDFVLYKSEYGIPGDVARCMATGLRMDRSPGTQLNCWGKTGLSNDEFDTAEPGGCSGTQNNFLQSLSVNESDVYYLLITNYRSEKGFTLKWTGKAIINPNTCLELLDGEKSITLSVSPNPAKEVIHCNILSKGDFIGNIKVINKLGSIVETEEIHLTAGKNEVQLLIPKLLSGDYYVSLIANGQQEVAKIEVIR